MTAHAPIPMVLHCPDCGYQHVDKADPEAGWPNEPHRSHLCHACGCIWRPCDLFTTGVRAVETRGTGDNWPREGEPTAPARPILALPVLDLMRGKG